MLSSDLIRKDTTNGTGGVEWKVYECWGGRKGRVCFGGGGGGGTGSLILSIWWDGWGGWGCRGD